MNFLSQLESGDSGSDLGEDVDAPRSEGGERLDLGEIFFSNEEYYRKLEELKRAHLQTMADLEAMYRHKLRLQARWVCARGGAAALSFADARVALSSAGR